MDERIGMNELKSAGWQHNRVIGSSGDLEGSYCQDRAQSFTAGENAVAHGLVEELRFLISCRQKPVKPVIDSYSLFADVRIESI